MRRTRTPSRPSRRKIRKALKEAEGYAMYNPIFYGVVEEKLKNLHDMY